MRSKSRSSPLLLVVTSLGTEDAEATVRGVFSVVEHQGHAKPIIIRSPIVSIVNTYSGPSVTETVAAITGPAIDMD